MVDLSPRGKPTAGPKHGRLILLIAILTVVVLVMWLIPQFMRDASPPAQPPRSRPTTRATSLPTLPAAQRQLLAAVADGTHTFDEAVVATLREQADAADVIQIDDPARLNPWLRGRRVRIVGRPAEARVVLKDPDDKQRDLISIRLTAGANRTPFCVWVPRAVYEVSGQHRPDTSLRVTGIYFKRWKTHEGEVLDTRTRRLLPQDIVPVIIAGPRGIRRATARPVVPAGPLGLPRQTWMLVIATVLTVGYVVVRVLVSKKNRKSRQTGGDRPRSLFSLPPRLSKPTPQREPTDEKKIEAARDALELAEQVDGAPAIAVTTPGRNYRIHVAPGLLKQTGNILGKLFGKPRNTALVTDENVAELYAETVRESLESAGFTVIVLTVPAGEASKNLAEAAKLYGPMLAAEMDRDALLVALGGGMVGDLGGFVAATYMRGIDFVQIPTSLLAQVDASVGGKVAVNLAEGKNLVGAFHQPRAVIADISVLSSLPDDQYASGLAEVVKHGVIRDEGLFMRLSGQRDRILARDEVVMAEIVAANCLIKAKVVSADEKESGVRAVLNYGHTVGHALESLGHYKLSHGAAVSLGMIAASHIAMSRGLIGDNQIERQRELLEAFGLPVTLKGIDADAVLRSMRHDKKVRGGKIRFILPTRIGRVEIYDDVTDAHIRTALAALSG